jgi:hypothetical protein
MPLLLDIVRPTRRNLVAVADGGFLDATFVSERCRFSQSLIAAGYRTINSRLLTRRARWQRLQSKQPETQTEREREGLFRCLTALNLFLLPDFPSLEPHNISCLPSEEKKE